MIKTSGKHYIVDWSEMYSTYVMKGNYTKSEEHRVKKVFELIHSSGFSCMIDAIHLIEDGNVVGLPVLTIAADFEAYDIHCIPPGYVGGKMILKINSMKQMLII
jgi:hypothetical protein